MDLSWQPVTGAAQRRRGRRLRAAWRHEQQSIAQALAAFTHHSSRGQKNDRAREWGHKDEYEEPRRQKPPPPQQELFRLYEEEPGGSWPPCLGEPRGPEEKVQQCTVELLADVVPMVQVLDVPVPQMEDQVVEVLQKFDVPSVEQVIAVPKSLCHFVVRRRQNISWKCRWSPDIHWRSLPCRPWGGGQQRHWRSRLWTFQFLRVGGGVAEVFKVYEQDWAQQRRTRSRSLIFQFLWGAGVRGGGPQGSLPEQNSTAANVKQIVDFLAREGLQGFRPGQGSTASSSSRSLSDADEGFKGFFFRTFPRLKKKCGGYPPVESESARQCQLSRAERSSNGSSRRV